MAGARSRKKTAWGLTGVAAVAIGALLLAKAQAAERVQLTTGFAVDCARHEVVAADHLRLILSPSPGANAESYMEVPRSAVVSIQAIPDPPPSTEGVAGAQAKTAAEVSSRKDLKPMLAEAERRHRVDADLLASVVRAESAGNVHAVSRTGARGLMQLMPGTATELGVRDAFVPEQNIDGGSSYLDRLLTRYHDNLVLALAAYNAGPAAVDRFHGVPPFRETQAYVARVIREFNRRKLALRSAAATAAAALAPNLGAQAPR